MEDLETITDYEKISKVFDVNLSFVKEIVDTHKLNQQSEIYTKMCELGYKFNYINFICLYHNNKQNGP